MSGRACRHDIIKNGNVLNFNWFDDREGLVQILAALPSRQTGLMRSISMALAGRNIERNVQFFGDSAANLYGLVETALPVAGFMQRHRYQAIRFFGRLFEVFREQRSKQACVFIMSIEFQ